MGNEVNCTTTTTTTLKTKPTEKSIRKYSNSIFINRFIEKWSRRWWKTKNKQKKKKIQEKNHYIHKSIVVYILHFFFSHEWKRMQMGQQRNNDEWKKPNLWKIRLNYKYMNINITNKWKNNNNNNKKWQKKKSMKYKGPYSLHFKVKLGLIINRYV